jgi:hypothetical protein
MKSGSRSPLSFFSFLDFAFVLVIYLLSQTTTTTFRELGMLETKMDKAEVRKPKKKKFIFFARTKY